MFVSRFSVAFVFAIAAFLVGGWLAIFAGIHHQGWGAAAYFFAGATVAATIIQWGRQGEFVNWFNSLCTILVVVFFAIDAFMSSPLLDPREMSVQTDFVNLLSSQGIDSTLLSDQEVKLVDDAREVCIQQQGRDLQVLSGNATKAVYLNSQLSLVDGAYSALTGKSDLRCLDYYRKLRSTQAQLFADLEKNHPWLLDKLKK